MITLSLVVFVTRAVLTSYVSSAWMIIPLQLLHGNSFALFTSAAVEMSRRNAPTPQWQASAQGLLLFVYASVGGVCGNLLGGWLFKVYGGRIMYRLKAALACIALFLWVLYSVWCPRISPAHGSNAKEELQQNAGPEDSENAISPLLKTTHDHCSRSTQRAKPAAFRTITTMVDLLTEHVRMCTHPKSVWVL